MFKKKRVYAFSKKAATTFVAISTILWSVGLPFVSLVPVAQASNPIVNLVQYINPTTFQVRFDQAMDLSTIVAGSFTLHTNATDTETITIATAATAGGVTTATVVASGAKISPTFTDYVKVACGSETNSPKNAGTEANSDCGNIGFVMIQGSVVISEVQIAGGTEGTTKQEFVEFYNRTGSAIDLDGYQLKYAIADGTETALMADLDGTHAGTDIPANGFYLVANAAYTPALDGADTWADTIDIPANATIILYNAQSAVVDMVGFGTNAASQVLFRESQQMTFGAELSQGQSIERKAVPTSTSVTMASAGTHANWGNGQDSSNNDFDFALRTTPQPQNSASTVETPSGEGGYQNQSPMINHMPIAQVVSGQDANVFAMMADAETPPNSLVPQLFYKTPSGNWTALSGQYVSGQPFKFIIPSAVTGSGSGTAFTYYLKVTDNNTPTAASICMYATGTACGIDDASARTSGAPWTVASVSSSGWDKVIKGRVVSGVTGIDNATVTLRGGGGLTFTTTSATAGETTGAFAFTGLPAGNFRLEATAPGYMDNWIDGVSSKAAADAAYTDWTMNLASGGGGGQGGDMNKPMVIFSAPMDGMMAAPNKINIPAGTGQIEAPILIGFSKDMDTTTITSDNIKIYPVTAAGLGTALTGVSVAYQAQGGTATLSDRENRSVEFGADRKVILYSSTALAVNSQYAIVLSASVKDTAGNALEGNKPGGGHTISFTTGGDFSGFTGQQMTDSFQTFMAGGSGGGGQFTPPYVTGSTPSNGAKNVPTNAKIVVNFSQPMDSVGINTTNSQGDYVKLYDTNYNNSGSGQDVTVTSITLDTTTKQSATITVGGSGLVASHSNYAVRVLGGANSAGGMTIAMPGQENTVMYQADFSTGSGSDTTAPAVLGTTLQTYTSTAPCAAGVNVCVSSVPTNVGVIEVSFSKDMDSSTITTSNITLKSGTTTVTTTVSYDQLSRSIKIAPSMVLYTTTAYTLTVGTGVKAMNGTALAAAYVVSFTTSATVDSASPVVQFVNGDDYKLAITFSEPMQSAKATDTNNWASSVLNPTNYVLYTDNGPPPSGQTALYFANTNLSTATTTETGGPLTFKYDASYSTVTIEGFKLMAGAVRGGFRLWVKNVKDLSGNIIQDTAKPADAEDFGANSAGGGVMNSSNTFGMIGPGGSTMSGPPTTNMLSGGTMAVTGFGGKDISMMGFKPIGVWPVNMLAGQESLYMIDLPLSSAIPASGQIILTFPTGFDVTNATDADPNKLWAHKDLNGPGLGTVVIASVAVNIPARTVTITLGSVATQANDFLHLEIDRIKNTTSSTDGDNSKGVTMGSGYQVDILTKTSATGGRTLETLKSMPFFIKAAGTNTLTGTITFSSVVTLSNLPIYLMSPMTGPLKTLVSGATPITYTFSNLPAGNYMIGSEPLQTIGGTDYFIDLNPIPQPIEITTGTTNKDITFQAQSSANKPNLTVYITGTFVNESVDIFAGGPGGFTVKTVTLNGTLTNAAPSTQTLYLPSTGTFMIGMGPAMPKGPQQSGSTQMPNWMPPNSIEVTAGGTGPGWTWKDADGAATLDAAANDGEITLGVTTADKTILGHVYTPTGSTGIQNAEVFAYSPMGGMGSHAQTDTNGAFSLKVIDGSYKVGTFVPGMPPSSEIPVEVKTVASVTTIYANGTATSDVIVRIQNPESMYTISGKVTDGTNVIKDASVYARRTDGPGNVGTKTDSMGKYILYVQTGIWTVGVFLPQYGNLPEQTVTVSTASKPDIDFAPALTTTYNSVSDRVYKDVNADGDYDADTDTPVANAHVDFVNTTTGYTNTAITDSNGLYKTNLPSGAYTATAWSPDIGKIPPQTVTVAGAINVDGTADIMTLGDTKTVTVNFVDALAAPVTLDKVYIQMDKIGTKDVSNEVNGDKVSSITLSIPVGTNFQYALDIDIPGVTDSALTVASPTPGIITANDINLDTVTDIYQVKLEDARTLNVTVPTLYTVSGTIQDDSGNPLPETVVNIKKSGGSDISLAVKTDSTGNYSVELPASGATPYLFQIDKSGYIDTGFSVAVAAAAPNTDLNATQASKTIKGQIKIGSTGVEGAKVYAKELGGGFASAETDPQGNYVLSVTPGDWKISAASDTYQEKEYQNASGQNIVVAVSTADKTGINVTLDAAKSGLAGLSNADLTPSSGTTFEHSAANLEVFAPQNSIAASQSNYQLEDKEISNVSSSPTAKTIGGKAIELVTYQPSGSKMLPLTDNFINEVTIEKQYAIAELTAEGIDTFVEADAVKMSYFDDSASNWEPVPTNITFLDSNEAPVIPDATLSNVSYVVYAGISDHMTVYSPTNPTPDGLAPAAPTAVAQSSGSGSSVVLTWTAPTTNTDSSALTDLLGYEIYRSTDGIAYVQVNTSDALTATYTDTSTSAFTSYYYKVTAADTGGNEGVDSSSLQVCSNKTISNGTITTSCSITCDATTGYVLSGNSCVASGTASAAGPTTPAAPTTTSATANISATAGGTTPTATTTTGGTAKAVIPAQTFSTATSVSITPTATTATTVTTTTAAVPTGMNLVGGYVYDYTASAAGQTVTSFAKAITLTLTYTDSQISGLDESSLTVNYWDGAKWVALATTVNAATNTLTTETTHFSYFAIMGKKTVSQPVAVISAAELKTAMIALIKQIIVLITKLIAELQAKLITIQG